MVFIVIRCPFWDDKGKVNRVMGILKSIVDFFAMVGHELMTVKNISDIFVCY